MVPNSEQVSAHKSAVKKKIANVEKYVHNPTTFGTVKRASRKNRKSISGLAARRSRQTNVTASDGGGTEQRYREGGGEARRLRVDDPEYQRRERARAKQRAGGVDAPSARVGALRHDDRGDKQRGQAERQVEPEDPAPAPDTDEDAADDRAGRARARRRRPRRRPRGRGARSSAKMCRSTDSVPGSLAAAPRPMMARPAISVCAFGASAQTTEPAQKTPAPVSITFLRPSSSPIIPQASMMRGERQGVSADHPLQVGTPACRSVWSCRARRLTMVLSRKVRNKIVHSAASAELAR